jgi:hypothetical protein
MHCIKDKVVTFSRRKKLEDTTSTGTDLKKTKDLVTQKKPQSSCNMWMAKIKKKNLNITDKF